MIPAQHTRLGVLFFNWYTRWQLHRYFRTIKLHGTYLNSNKPILLIANHFSWWDGFIQLHLNNKVFQRRFHVMMLEEQLSKFKILRKGGAFSINKGKRDMVESIRYCRQLLHHNQNIVLIFPQGEIQSLYTTPLLFEPGIEHILGQHDMQVQVVFNVNLIDYFSHKKPALHIYYTTYPADPSTEISAISNAFNAYMRECIEVQKKQATN